MLNLNSLKIKKTHFFQFFWETKKLRLEISLEPDNLHKILQSSATTFNGTLRAKAPFICIKFTPRGKFTPMGKYLPHLVKYPYG